MNWKASKGRADSPPYTITFADCPRGGVYHNVWINFGAPGQKHIGATFDREEAKRMCETHAAKQRTAA